ncbi:hypothetical protein EWM64_g2237 [Hericium alpestre]|uniref:Carboxylic ester hydrolase n=1 Tax=Hericium alpestre TaxID=135208 RepID=A0A4Z0A5X0_9AGAM|nr:hypothetical protein EWM64_g2237 [Hericium alpestre]
MMFFLRASTIFAILTAHAAVAAPTSRAAIPTVELDNATFVGQASGSVNKFLGIPFAQPPTGDLRFQLPKPNDPYTGTHTVTAFGPSCPQQAVTLPIPPGLAQDAIDFLVNTVYGLAFPDSEDCLTVNVVAPSNVDPGTKLPVLVWIFGGGFELGGPSIYDGGGIVQRSIDLDEPVVYVSLNYRVSASQEVKEAGVGNLGLQDQRQALRWIQKYIGAFGGDPTKVTIWGESAGAISAALQMITNGGDTEGLFRAAFMESGSPIPVGDISHGQPYYDDLVERTGCSGSSDTLQCLREVPYSTLKDAMNKSPSIFAYQSLALAWVPRTDGVFLKDGPQSLVQQGSVANIPFITGDCDDEGTLFSLSSLNVTTDKEAHDFMSNVYFAQASSGQIDQILDTYPSDLTKGSPFDTGDLDALSPQFKRIAAIQGDAVFQAPRRFFLQQRSGKQNTWSFLSKRLKALPFLGSVHASDILNVYGGGEMADYLIRFATNLDPNGNTGISWPKYTTQSPNLLTFLDGVTPLEITQDTYRIEGFNLLTQTTLAYPL